MSDLAENDVTAILQAAQAGDENAAAKLLPLVYDELRQLAAMKLSREQAGQTLQATALVHEAWLRMVKHGSPQFDGRGHFFAVAAEAMRRILVEAARRKRSLKRGGAAKREELEESKLADQLPSDELRPCAVSPSWPSGEPSPC